MCITASAAARRISPLCSIGHWVAHPCSCRGLRGMSLARPIRTSHERMRAYGFITGARKCVASRFVYSCAILEHPRHLLRRGRWMDQPPALRPAQLRPLQEGAAGRQPQPPA